EFNLNILAKFDALIECKYWKPHFKSLLQHLHGKSVDLIFCPHGQSDKGFQAPLLAPYAMQDIVLLYGELLVDMLKQLSIWPLSRTARIGDFRKLHYEMHQQFYDDLAEKELFSKLPKNRPTLLYAPTWFDADGSTSFFTGGKYLLKEFPQEWNLVVKIHPLLKLRQPAEYESIIHQVEKRENFLIIDTFPPVHPILKKADVYLGDSSSVGFDFLPFHRPMFFFSTKNTGKIHQCGISFTSFKDLYQKIETNASFSKKKEDLYRYAFDPVPDLRETINSLLT
ncbi:MAG: hypothetical protein FJZ64_03715, partial [Chlamydiae bacterium]|nr:hypothetical protein [Chlamydiota bacterium]